MRLGSPLGFNKKTITIGYSFSRQLSNRAEPDHNPSEQEGLVT